MLPISKHLELVLALGYLAAAGESSPGREQPLKSVGHACVRQDGTVLMQIVNRKSKSTAQAERLSGLVHLRPSRKALGRKVQPAGVGRAARIRDSVDVFIGTGGHGHTFPGATTPWGAVQATPWTHAKDADKHLASNWDTQSGYNEALAAPQFFGMAHSALSGAGSGEMGELRLLPSASPSIGEMWLDAKSAEASPGRFAAMVGAQGGPADLGIESAATPHGAIHRFSFPPAKGNGQMRAVQVLLSAPPGNFYGYKLEDHKKSMDSDHRLEGCAESQNSGIGGAVSYLCFVVGFDGGVHKPEDEDIKKPDVTFQLQPGERPVLVRVAISRTDLEHARKAFKEELEGKSLENIAASARASWDKALSVVQAEIEPISRKRAFYTALYHTMIAPNLLSDSDGAYRLQSRQAGNPEKGRHVPLDRIDDDMPASRAAEGDRIYHTFSFWDTYRSLHPLMNLIHPNQSRHFGKSILAIADSYGFIPRFQLLASPADMMEGDGGSIILATMAREGLVDADSAFRVLNSTRREPVGERKYLEDGGYIPSSEEHSVSKALEQAKADSCVSHLARDLGHASEADFFESRARSVYRHWDPEHKLFVPLGDSFAKSFLLFRGNENRQTEAFTEGTALQYSWGAEFDVSELVRLRGGKERFARDLDYFFEEAPTQDGQPDMSGNLHGMSAGNEPTQHVPYLYAAGGCPSGTQVVVDRIVKSLYSDDPAGLPGNDDMGQTSSWLVFSILGLYPVSPCSGDYVLGRPFVSEAEVQVAHGTLRIKVHDQAEDHPHVVRARWQDADLDLDAAPTVSHQQLSGGGLLEFWMAAQPAGSRGGCGNRTEG